MLLRRIIRHGEVVFLLILVLVSAYLIAVGLEIPVGRSRSVIKPSTWPVMSLGIVVLCSVILLALRFLRRHKPAAEEKSDEAVPHPQRAFYTLVFMVVYLAALPYLGFIAVTLITLAIYMTSLGARRIYAIMVPVCMTALVTGIFGIALKVPLPRGVSIFRDLSQLFY